MSFGGDWAQINYAGNYGGPGMITSCNGIIVPSKGDEFVSSPDLGPVSIAAVTDGTSNTAMFSEHLLGAGNGLDGLTAGYVSPYVAGTPLAKRCLFQVSSVAPKPDQGAAGVAVAQQLVAACRSIPGGTVPAEDAGTGYAWLYTQGYDTMNVSYSHVMTPNTYSCTGAESGFFGAQGNFTSDSSGGGWLGASTATSNHPGGVNVGFGDGSVKFIKDSVSYPDLVGPGNPQPGRSHQLRLLLIPTRSVRSRTRFTWGAVIAFHDGSRPSAMRAVAFQEDDLTRSLRPVVVLASLASSNPAAEAPTRTIRRRRAIPCRPPLTGESSSRTNTRKCSARMARCSGIRASPRSDRPASPDRSGPGHDRGASADCPLTPIRNSQS